MACWKCGGSEHEGKCSPDNFLYYRCKKCKGVFDLPWDAVAFCGLVGIGCCATKEDPRFADELWESITYEEFLTEQKQKVKNGKSTQENQRL